jgi:hypothetical protein
MKKVILFLTACIGCILQTMAQSEWTEWSTLSCFHGLSARMKNIGLNKVVNQYEWGCQVKNNYDRKVTFDMTWKVGNEEKLIGQFTLQPGAITNATSYYFNSDINYLYVTVTKVCFAEASAGGCGVNGMCYAECDEGSPNIPSGCGTKKEVGGWDLSGNADTDFKKFVDLTCQLITENVKLQKNYTEKNVEKFQAFRKNWNSFAEKLDARYSEAEFQAHSKMMDEQMKKCPYSWKDYIK